MTIWWAGHWTSHIAQLPRDQTINATVYCMQIKKMHEKFTQR